MRVCVERLRHVDDRGAALFSGELVFHGGYTINEALVGCIIGGVPVEKLLSAKRLDEIEALLRAERVRFETHTTARSQDTAHLRRVQYAYLRERAEAHRAGSR